MEKGHGLRLGALLAASLALAGCDDRGILGSGDFLGCDEVRRISLPAVVDGDLRRGDCRLRSDQSPVDFYEFSVSGTLTVFIDMESFDLDAYVILYDEDGRVIDEDDDGGVDTDASLAVTLRSGRYVVAANTFEGETGEYRLYVEAD